jgi:hypothetical protein
MTSAVTHSMVHSPGQPFFADETRIEGPVTIRVRGPGGSASSRMGDYPYGLKYQTCQWPLGELGSDTDFGNDSYTGDFGQPTTVTKIQEDCILFVKVPREPGDPGGERQQTIVLPRGSTIELSMGARRRTASAITSHHMDPTVTGSPSSLPASTQDYSDKEQASPPKSAGTTKDSYGTSPLSIPATWYPSGTISVPESQGLINASCGRVEDGQGEYSRGHFLLTKSQKGIMAMPRWRGEKFAHTKDQFTRVPCWKGPSAEDPDYTRFLPSMSKNGYGRLLHAGKWGRQRPDLDDIVLEGLLVSPLIRTAELASFFDCELSRI